uniref:Uncharacterized protein n=1 Tax=Candidatus Kentrum sp. LFY TaxID=2126342 RepID=A0A450ULS8_9GAMM|nr:MAG: hypothetical protein BECKLFY1418A_GA0070994_103211 [Candidatus Kentron sp. LFY]
MKFIIGFFLLLVTSTVAGFDNGGEDALCKKDRSEITDPKEKAEYKKRCSEEHHYSEEGEREEKENGSNGDEKGRKPEPEHEQAQESKGWFDWAWNGVIEGASSLADRFKGFFGGGTSPEDSGTSNHEDPNMNESIGSEPIEGPI